MPLETKFDIDIVSYLNNKKVLIDSHLAKLLSENNNFKEPKELWDAVKYSLLDSGKRIRGILCLATFESITGNNLKDNKTNFLHEDCLSVAASVETIHTMSLIHDDLPCMDNDDLRRGKPSCHKAFGEATAVLAGDVMLTLAFHFIINNTNSLNENQKNEIINTIVKACNFGLVPGQILDLSTTSKNINITLIEKIARLKTAELIKASIMSGAIIALGSDFGSKNKKVIYKPLENYALKMGIAFQIIDDILDVTTDTKTLGKTSGKDEKQNKSTFPSILGISESKKMAEKLILEAKNELLKIDKIGINNQTLSALADYIINRIN